MERHAFYQLFGQLVTRMTHQLVDNVFTTIQLAALRYNHLTHIVVIHQVSQNILYVIHLCPFLKYSAERRIFLVNNMFTEDIAIKRLVGVIGGHPLNLYSWPMQQHSIKPSILARHIYSRF